LTLITCKIWAFAVTIIEIATHNEPFPGLDAIQAATKVANGQHHPIPENLCAPLQSLMK
jgi:hypothetical protein